MKHAAAKPTATPMPMAAAVLMPELLLPPFPLVPLPLSVLLFDALLDGAEDVAKRLDLLDDAVAVVEGVTLDWIRFSIWHSRLLSIRYLQT